MNIQHLIPRGDCSIYHMSCRASMRTPRLRLAPPVHPAPGVTYSSMHRYTWCAVYCHVKLIIRLKRDGLGASGSSYRPPYPESEIELLFSQIKWTRRLSVPRHVSFKTTTRARRGLVRCRACPVVGFSYRWYIGYRRTRISWAVIPVRVICVGYRL